MPAPATPSSRAIALLALLAAGGAPLAACRSERALPERPPTVPDFTLRDTACVVDGPPPADTADGGHARQLPPAATVECVLVAGGAVRRLRLLADTATDLVTTLVLLDPSGSEVQRLPVDQDEPPSRWAPVLLGTDFDADGARDLALRDWAGATGNVGHEVWRFDRASGRFAHDSTLSATPGLVPVPGRPCVDGSMKGGMAGLIYGRERLCREGGRWRQESAESQDYDAALRAFVRVSRERRGDSLAIVRVDTVRGP